MYNVGASGKMNVFILPLPIAVFRAADPGSLFVTHRRKWCIEFTSRRLCFVFAPREFHLRRRRISPGKKKGAEQLTHWWLIKRNNTDVPVESNFMITNQISWRDICFFCDCSILSWRKQSSQRFFSPVSLVYLIIFKEHSLCCWFLNGSFGQKWWDLLSPCIYFGSAWKKDAAYFIFQVINIPW